ncbi:MAG: HPr(Ser) kinase/phosphatase [Chromatiaceae bacterium]|nr:HPr(Ser) kinase/phosphatase [Gammaproteobacteria bacterium]MCP5305197.1 HPr(Ser) kinase/phosphatase [Chromatiaceae bacterium]MCP5315156.1 HPr(Ser) kinase/phosphatase [Chromatiaceae bacterium]
MPHSIRVNDLVDALSERLQLVWVAGRSGSNKTLLSGTSDTGSGIVAGPLNYIHPNRVQVIGPAEETYLDSLQPANRQQALQQLFAEQPALVVLVNGIEGPPELPALADRAEVALMRSPLPDSQVLDNLQYYASLFLSEKTTLHGVFLEVLGMGVLLTGDPAVGKSELALDLITRGNRLVADDAPEFTRIAPDIISGTCPALLREFLEVRGLGILNIRAMFGDSSIKRTKYLRLIVHLKRMSSDEIAGMDRLSGAYANRDVLGVSIPQVTVPVAPGRNLAVLVESAVRNHLLRLKGYDATEVLIERQQQAILDQR